MNDRKSISPLHLTVLRVISHVIQMSCDADTGDHLSRVLDLFKMREIKKQFSHLNDKYAKEMNTQFDRLHVELTRVTSSQDVENVRNLIKSVHKELQIVQTEPTKEEGLYVAIYLAKILVALNEYNASWSLCETVLKTWKKNLLFLYDRLEQIVSVDQRVLYLVSSIE